MTSGRTPGFLLRADSTHLSRMYVIPARVTLPPCLLGNSGYECLAPPVKPVAQMYWRTMVAVGSMSGTMRVLPPLPVILIVAGRSALKSPTEMSAILNTSARIVHQTQQDHVPAARHLFGVGLFEYELNAFW